MTAGFKQRCCSEGGWSSLLLAMSIWVATLVAIVAIDITAYFTAAARAQTLADSAALAAVTPDVVGASEAGLRDPASEAAKVVTVAAGHLEECTCQRGSEYARVEVSVEVPGLFIPTVGAGRVTATAEAVLAPPAASVPVTSGGR